MEPTSIPKRLFAKHPELAQIHEALDAYFEGKPIIVKCPTCGELLKVTEIKATHSLWVTCPNGHIKYHEQRHPKTPI